MRSLITLGIILLSVVSYGYAQQVNPFLVPERANSRIRASVEIAKHLKSMKYNRIAVVYMETSDLCALFAASLTASLRTLGVEAYYIKGGDGLEDRLKAIQPFHVYMAYFGEMPHDQVQLHFNQDLKRVLKYDKKPSLILQPVLFGMGFVRGVLGDEELLSSLEGLPMLTFVFEGGSVKPVKISIKDFDVKVIEHKHERPKGKK
ncbi:MAG: hypothetical protein N3C57_05215 [Aquificaceae bacterium]|nr:hypothetical protein [Aquificaceae bacterium]MCS7307689.1 hypothetical protein [Aquificaceae bacterium]MCX8076415.1 hypothetical protein [Aquificaceae bacterium]MDW8434468.1 hypothetical protein [Aquificaceae bacterium]